MALESIFKFFSVFHLELGCADTELWDDGYGNDCATYGAFYCLNGAPIPGYEYTVGHDRNYPELNCCACGKERRRLPFNRGAFIQNVTVPVF